MKKTVLIVLSVILMLTIPMTSLAAGINSTPIIILKCDDLKCNYDYIVENYEKIYELLEEEGVTASFGIMGRSSTNGKTEELWENINKYIDSGIEIWHHGWTHEKNRNLDGQPSEFHGLLDYEGMKTNFQKTLDLVRENANGYEITTFGSPYNAVSDECIQMLNYEFPQINTLFYVTNEETSYAFRINNSMKIESGTGVADFEVFLKSYNPELEYAAIQSHPGQFDDTSREEFRKMIQFLKEKKSVFMTPSQYTDYVSDLKMYRESPGEKIAVLCYNKIVDFDVMPYLENDRTFIPIRAVSENIGAQVEWDEKNQLVTIVNGDCTLKLNVGSDLAYIDGREVKLDAPVREIDGRTMVPLRFIAEAFGAEVQWDNDLNMAIIK